MKPAPSLWIRKAMPGLVVLPFLLSSCAGLGGAREAAFPGEYYGEAREAPVALGEARVAGKAESRMAAPAPAPAKAAAAVGQVPAERAEPVVAAAAEPQQAESRRRIYSGSCRLQVDDPEERKKRIAVLVEERGGYVETAYEQAVIVRVPAEKFQEIFQLVLGLGEVLHKAVETQDVTEYFTDLQVRLEIAGKTRDRLYLLLEKIGDVEERLKILREIRRLSEEIERARLTLELLERQVAFSRISVELVPRLAQEQVNRERIPFRWIANLNPIYPSLGRLGGRIELPLGDEFAVFERESYFRAEGPEGTRVRVATTPNRPRGDADFWRKALQVHLGGCYRSGEPLDLGPVRAVLFTSKDRSPFYYLIGVVAAADKLHVAEVFSPNETARLQRLEPVSKAMGELQVR
jgi:hypothetical protein